MISISSKAHRHSGPAKRHGSLSHFAVRVRSAILQVKLRRLHSLIVKMSGNLTLISHTVPELNRSCSALNVSFTWFPGSSTEPGALLIRSDNLGLVVPASYESAPHAVILQSHGSSPAQYVWLSAEEVLAMITTNIRASILKANP